MKTVSSTLLAALLVIVALPRPPGLADGYHFELALMTLAAILLAFMLGVGRRPVGEEPFPKAAWLALGLMTAGYLLGMVHAGLPSSTLLAGSVRLTGGVLLLAVYLVAQDDRGRRILARGAALALLCLGIGGVWFLAGRHGLKRVLVGVPGHGNVFAYLIIVLLPWGVMAAREDRRRLWRILAWGGLALSALMVPFTRSAGAVLALAAAWGTYGWYLLARDRLWLRVFTVILVTLVAAGGVMLLILGHQVSFGSRVDLIEAGWRLWLRAPWTGQGPGQFIFLYPAVRSTSDLSYPATTALMPMNHVHLEPLNTAFEGGVLAAAGLVLLTLLALRGAWRALRREEGPLGGALPWLTLVAAVVQGAVTLATSREGLLVWVLAAGTALALDPAKCAGWSPRRLLPVLALPLLLALPLHVKRICADHEYDLGRDWRHYWRARDLNRLRLALSYWPEDLQARGLLVYGTYRRAMQHTETDSVVRRSLLEQARAEADTLQAIAPDFFKVTIWQARVLFALGEKKKALEVLNSSDKFTEFPEYHDLLKRIQDAMNTPADSAGSGKTRR